MWGVSLDLGVAGIRIMIFGGLYWGLRILEISMYIVSFWVWRGLLVRILIWITQKVLHWRV